MGIIISVLIGIVVIIAAIHLFGFVAGMVLFVVRFLISLLAVPAVAGLATWFIFGSFWPGALIGLIYPVRRTIKEGDLFWVLPDDGQGGTSHTMSSSGRSVSTRSQGSSTSSSSSSSSSDSRHMAEYKKREGDNLMDIYRRKMNEAEELKSKAEIEENYADHYANSYSPDPQRASECRSRASSYYSQANRVLRDAESTYDSAQRCYEEARWYANYGS